jgi:hypothetical protein
MKPGIRILLVIELLLMRFDWKMALKLELEMNP